MSIEEALKALKPVLLEMNENQVLLLRVPAEQCQNVSRSADFVFGGELRVVVMPDTYKIDVVRWEKKE